MGMCGGILRRANVCRPGRNTNFGQKNANYSNPNGNWSVGKRSLIADGRVLKHAVEVVHFGLYVRVDYYTIRAREARLA